MDGARTVVGQDVDRSGRRYSDHPDVAVRVVHVWGDYNFMRIIGRRRRRWMRRGRFENPPGVAGDWTALRWML